MIDPEAEVGLSGDRVFRGVVTFSSNIDGELGTGAGGGSTFGLDSPPLSVGVHVITATAVDPFGAVGTDSITIQVTNQAPTASIVLPADNSTFPSSQPIRFQGGAFDVDEQIPGANLVWTSNVDGLIGSGEDFFATLTPGAHTITLTATDAFGLVGQDTVTLNMIAGTGFPTSQILSPANDSTFPSRTLVRFVGQGLDPEDGVLLGASLMWFSNRDGFLGEGITLDVILSGPAGDGFFLHTITLLVTDSDGNESMSNIFVEIGQIL